MSPRIAITGIGMVTAAGIGVEACWQRLLSGRSAVARVDLWDPTGMPCHIAGQVPGWPEVPPTLGGLGVEGRPGTFAAAAALEALAMAGLADADSHPAPRGRRAVLVAGGFDDTMLAMMAGAADRALADGEADFSAVTAEQLMQAFAQAEVLPHMERYSQVRIMQMLARHLGARQSLTVSTACAGGNTALGDAVSMIRRGEVDVALCVGVDTLITREMMGGFCNLTAMSTRNDDPARASRPFDAERDGFVMGEGAGAILIEREDIALARGAEPLAELAGFGYSADAYRLTDPHPEGTGMAAAMQHALDDAGITVEDVHYINVHGTSTAANDKAETKAIRLVFGDVAERLVVSGTKAVIGHLIHGAGVVGTVVAAKTVLEQTVHPTANLEHPDPACDLDCVPEGPRSLDIDGVLVNAFGFGGQNATVAVRAWSAQQGTNGAG